jgi:hypothetical protein
MVIVSDIECDILERRAYTVTEGFDAGLLRATAADGVR